MKTAKQTQNIFSDLSLPDKYRKAIEASRELRDNLKKQIELQEKLEEALKKDAETGRLIDNPDEQTTEKNYRCEKCWHVKKIRTNHYGPVYGLRCLWSCTSGVGQVRNFLFHDGETEERECSFYESSGGRKARHIFALSPDDITNITFKSVGTKG